MRIEPITSDWLEELRAQLIDLYRHCFAEPPWNEQAHEIDRYSEILTGHVTKPGMFGFAARTDSELYGVIYGWPSADELPDDPFHQALGEAVPPAEHHRVLAPAVTVSELMVHPGQRGRGIGRALLDQFVRDAPSAWLVTHPEAGARSLYDSAGWTASVRFANQSGDPRVLYTWSK
jgi:GNAT superfamily N-acetyltransferase